MHQIPKTNANVTFYSIDFFFAFVILVHFKFGWIFYLILISLLFLLPYYFVLFDIGFCTIIRIVSSFCSIRKLKTLTYTYTLTAYTNTLSSNEISWTKTHTHIWTHTNTWAWLHMRWYNEYKTQSKREYNHHFVPTHAIL